MRAPFLLASELCLPTKTEHQYVEIRKVSFLDDICSLSKYNNDVSVVKFEIKKNFAENSKRQIGPLCGKKQHGNVSI